MTPERSARIQQAVKRRQLDLAVILENVHDPHNIGAVLRSCDSVGIQEVFLLVTDPQIKVEEIFLSKRTSSGARKWLDIYIYDNLARCLKDVRKKYSRILGTKLNKTAKSLYKHDLTGSMALAFGNEHEGLSDQFVKALDGNIEIPQYGMVRSLNISVACAVTLYEALRQREINNAYIMEREVEPTKQELIKRYNAIQEEKIDPEFPQKKLGT